MLSFLKSQVQLELTRYDAETQVKLLLETAPGRRESRSAGVFVETRHLVLNFFLANLLSIVLHLLDLLVFFESHVPIEGLALVVRRTRHLKIHLS